jgi:hypothetical protein
MGGERERVQSDNKPTREQRRESLHHIRSFRKTNSKKRREKRVMANAILDIHKKDNNSE